MKTVGQIENFCAKICKTSTKDVQELSPAWLVTGVGRASQTGLSLPDAITNAAKYC